MSAQPGARRPRLAALLVGALTLAPALTGWTSAPSHAEGETGLFLVTLHGPGTTGHRGPAPAADVAERMLAEQDAVLGAIGAGEPAYRWTTALNGFAVELAETQAEALAADPRVDHVEENSVRPLAAAERSASAPGAPRLRGATSPRGGAGTVIGFVDTGIDPSGPAFSPLAPLGPDSRRFRGGCENAPHDSAWDASDCSAKVVGAHHFVAGFGADRLRAASALSPRDTHGHGTETASVAAGAPDVPARADHDRLGRFSGIAPAARIAVYKACWSAPDPDDDGCATADLVAAIDRATSDRVDVLNLSVGGPGGAVDTVERALLGATEAGVVVVGAAGNGGRAAYAAHPVPWVISVGATVAAERLGTVLTPGGARFAGAMAATEPVRRARLVVGADVPADAATRAEARVCAPGSLDARQVSRAIVVCQRGEVARVEKSETVRLADGAGMVLVNAGPGSVDADLHSVPTVHLGEREGRALLRWAERQPRPRVRLVSRGWSRGPARIARFSTGGDPTWSVLKPDLVAPGTGVLAATTGGWEVVSGTSVATAHVSGAAAVLLGRRGATPAEVRSALLTSATQVAGRTGLRAGTGQARVDDLPPLAYLVRPRHHRGWLTGRLTDVDLPHALLRSGAEVRRTITNTGDRPVWLVARRLGFDSAVRVSPTAALVRPGRQLTFTVSLEAPPGATDRGTVVWRGEHGEETRLTVVVTR